MESDTDKHMTPRDAETIIRGDQAHGSNVNTAVINSNNLSVKINSLSINLGIVKGKDGPKKCNHFSIRGYASRMRERDGYSRLLLDNGSTLELPPMDVPHFRYWLCQSCLQDYGGGSTSQEVALVSQFGKSMMQPCKNSYSNCHGLPIVRPFGEGTSGHKPVDERINNDENTLAVAIQQDAIQPSSENVPGIEEEAKIDSIDTNIITNENVVDDSKKAGTSNGSLTSQQPVDQSTESDPQNHDPSGHPRRKARKVRLLTELLCGSSEQKQHQKKERTTPNLPDITTPNPTPTPTPTSPPKKRKIPQTQEWRPVDVTSQSQKKVKVVKGDATVKVVERSQELVTSEGDNGQNSDKYQCKKHGTQKSSKLGKVTSDPVAAWRSIFSDMNRSDKFVPVSNDTLEKRNDPFLEKRCINASKKVMENPMRNNQLFGEDIQRPNIGDSRMRGNNGQSDNNSGLGLGLSLNYEPQSRVSWMPPLPNRGPPIQDHNHGRKDGFFFGESSIGMDHQGKGRSVYNVRDGHAPRTAFLQDQQPYHPQMSHGSFSQHQNLDFSDPHNKRNNGVRGYPDLMRAHNYQRQEVFSNGRSDEREIVELMAKIQHERNLGESRNYNDIPNYHKVPSFNQGMPIPHHQYPPIRRPPSSSIPTSGFFHQEPLPTFPNYDNFSHPSNNIQRVSDNSHYHESRENNNRIPHQSSNPTNIQMMEAFNNGRPGNVWSNMEMHTKWSNRNKGKNIMNLDLNVMAPNVLEEQNNHMGSLDHSSYSNEAIPAMQLLSLMDAGKKSITDKKKSTPKPFSCYNGITGKPNSSFPYSGMQSSVQKPIENSRNFIMGHGVSSHSSHSLPVTNSFSSFFHSDQTVTNHGSQFYKPQEKKQRGMSSGSVSGHKYRQEDSYGFPLPWHATEGSLGTRNVRSETEICTINQNPADFSIPGPENVYMIDVENLKFRGDRVFYSREGTV